MWCCAGDEGWPFGAVLRGEAPNRRVLGWLMTVVVSDVEQVDSMRRVGSGKTVRGLEGEIAVEVSLSKLRGHQNRGGVGGRGRSLACAR
jgi:hypothetical protein